MNTLSGFLYHIYSSVSFKSLKHGFLWKLSTKSSRLHQDQSFYSLSTAYLSGSQTLPHIVNTGVGGGGLPPGFWHLVPKFMEKAMAPHSSTLAWKIPWTEEPGRLQSMGSLRVGHD